MTETDSETERLTDRLRDRIWCCLHSQLANATLTHGFVLAQLFESRSSGKTTKRALQQLHALAFDDEFVADLLSLRLPQMTNCTESWVTEDEWWVLSQIQIQSNAMKGELKKLVWNYCHCHTIIVTGVIYSIQIRFGYRFRYSQSDSYIQSHTVVVGLLLTVCDMLCL